MKLKELLNHFNINVKLPEYLYEESFNDVFKTGTLEEKEYEYKIIAKTRKNITHTLIIKENEEYPIIIQSELKNGSKNGFKFGQSPDDHLFIGDKI